MEYLFYYMPPTLNKIWENKDQQNTVNFAQFFCKNWIMTYLTATPSKLFFIIFVDFFSEIINPWKNQ